METSSSQQLSINETFQELSINGGNTSFDSTFFFEVDLRFLDSLRWSNIDNDLANEFDIFDLPTCQSPPPSITSDGAQASSIMSRRSSSSSAVFHSAESTPSSMTPCSSSRSIANSKNCIRSPKKILAKYLSFLIMPFYKKVRDLRSKPAAPRRFCKDSSVRGRSTRTTGAAAAAAFSSFEWCRSNSDISIYDAILHCKRSNGQEN